MSANTWNVRSVDMPDLIFNVEQMENAGKKVYGLVLTDRIPFTFDGEEKRLAGGKFGTLEDILDWLESNPGQIQKPFCETISGGHRGTGEQLYTAPCVPVQEDVYVWWNHEDLEQAPGTRTVLMDCGYADKDDLSDPTAEAWEDMERLNVHSEPLPVTVENVLAYAHHEVFRVNVPERVELIPANEILDDLEEHFAQQTEQD